MRIETLLYVYLFICSGMIVFNIITAIVLKRRDRRTVRASARFRQHILQQIERINTGQQVERRHKKYLSRQLTRTGNMIAFDKMLEDLYREEPRQATEYLSQLGGVIVYLTIRYGRKDRIEAAYFPYIIKKYRLIENRPFSGVVDAMYTLLRESSIYCRENAMQALYTTGDCDCIMKALKLLDGGESFFHEKLLTDGLLEFTGDHEALGRCIEKSFADFSPEMQVAMMNFLRLDSGEHWRCCRTQRPMMKCATPVSVTWGATLTGRPTRRCWTWRNAAMMPVGNMRPSPPQRCALTPAMRPLSG